ncbi:MAG TPA: hypothetical protein VNM72_14660 [Blastocatellia bacterium]|nr:hypothetical protein [Blastocatellia bacterium]
MVAWTVLCSRTTFGDAIKLIPTQLSVCLLVCMLPGHDAIWMAEEDVLLALFPSTDARALMMVTPKFLRRG